MYLRGGLAPEPLGAIVHVLVQGQLEFLPPPRAADRPALVREMPLDLPDDGRRGAGGELDAAAELEPVEGLDQPDRGHLGQVVEPLAPVPEPARQVLDERQVQLHELAADALPLLVTGWQRGELLEQLPRAPPLTRGMLDSGCPQRDVHGRAALDLDHVLNDDRALDVDSLHVPRLGELNDRRLTAGVTDRHAPRVGSRRRVELLGQRDLDLPRHTDPGDSLVFRSTIVSRSPGPTRESTLPASAVITVHPKVSLAGCRLARPAAVTAMVITPRPSVKAHPRLAPGPASLSSIAQA